MTEPRKSERLSSWALGCIAAIAVAGSALAQTPVERGSYLVNGILTCGNCHTPRGPGGVWDMSKQLSGGPQTWDEVTFKVKGANITPDPETGIGKWSDADIKRSLITGVRPNGKQIAPIMPYGFYKVFTPADIGAVVAYLKSVRAVGNAVEPPVYKASMHVDIPPGADKAMSEADMADPVKRGFYLATIGHCMECHTPLVNDVHDYAQLGKRRPAVSGAVGRDDFAQYHIACDGRAWRVERCRDQGGDCAGPPPGRHQTQAADGIFALRHDDRSGPQRHRGLFAHGATEGVKVVFAGAAQGLWRRNG
jgi:mono/diheme cytochrome c family protein